MSDLPAGWKAVRDGFVLTITAPAADDDTAAEEGEIELTPYSRRGSKGASVIIKVAVAEAPIVLTCNEDIGDVIPFRLSDKKVFTFTASQNVVDVNVSDAPKGWTLKPDLEKLSLEISVPDQAAADLAAEGSIVLTPISNRGTEGDPVTIRVQVSITAPVLEFDVTSQYFGLGEMVTIHVAKAINVADVGLKSVPEGWTAAPDFGSQTCALTAPATVSGAASSGKFVFTATSASQETQEVEVEVKFNGLHDAGDFVKFGDAVAAGASIDDFLLGGEVNLFADADLSQAGRDVIVGAAGEAFLGNLQRQRPYDHPAHCRFGCRCRPVPYAGCRSRGQGPETGRNDHLVGFGCQCWRRGPSTTTAPNSTASLRRWPLPIMPP